MSLARVCAEGDFRRKGKTRRASLRRFRECPRDPDEEFKVLGIQQDDSTIRYSFLRCPLCCSLCTRSRVFLCGENVFSLFLQARISIIAHVFHCSFITTYSFFLYAKRAHEQQIFKYFAVRTERDITFLLALLFLAVQTMLPRRSAIEDHEHVGFYFENSLNYLAEFLLAIN